MFSLSELQHKLRLPPELLDQPLETAVRNVLESTFLDKVINKLGLCVSVYDIKSVDGGFVLPNDGAPTYTVVFRMVMFRPYVGEVIAAKVKEANSKGLQLTLGFFDDIYIPSYAMHVPSVYVPDPENPCSKQFKWVWKYYDRDLIIEDEEKVHFRVAKIDYPQIPLEQEEGSKPFAPMVVSGLISEEGLGPASWWEDDS